MKSILVPVDFSKNSMNACIYAIRMTEGTDAAITLIHVFEKPLLLAKSYKDAMLFDAERKMKAFTVRIKKQFPAFTGKYVILQGKSHQKIHEYARKKKVSLIVTGSTGYGPLARLLLGNPSLSLMRNAPCMVMSVPPKASFKGFAKIVYATDLSNAGLKQANKLIPIARQYDSELVFIYISLILGKETNVEMQDVTKKIRAAVRYPKISGYVVDDLDADEGILFFLQKVKANCLVLFADQKPLLKKIFHKSVIKSLSLHTTLPLLVLHEKDYQPSVIKKTETAVRNKVSLN